MGAEVGATAVVHEILRSQALTSSSFEASLLNNNHLDTFVNLLARTQYNKELLRVLALACSRGVMTMRSNQNYIASRVLDARYHVLIPRPRQRLALESYRSSVSVRRVMLADGNYAGYPKWLVVSLLVLALLAHIPLQAV
jgi:hypothetical protein